MNMIFNKFQIENALEKMTKEMKKEQQFKTKQENIERSNAILHELVLRLGCSLTRNDLLALIEALALKIENKNTASFLKELFLYNPKVVKIAFDYFLYESKHTKMSPTYNVKLFRTILVNNANQFPTEEKMTTSNKSAMEMFSGIKFGAKK